MGDAAFTALTTQRLVLRRFRPEDLDAFVAYRSDPETARYQSWEAPYQPSQARQFLQELEAIHPDTPGEWFQFAVAPRHTDRLIGDCGSRAWKARPSGPLSRDPTPMAQLKVSLDRPLLSVVDRQRPMLRARRGHGRRGRTRLCVAAMVTSSTGG